MQTHVDFLAILPEELTILIFSFLPPHDLNTCQLINTTAHRVADTNFLWRDLCIHRWQDKFVQKSQWDLISDPQPKQRLKLVYWTQERDSKRKTITVDELTDSTWSLHFHQSQGARDYPLFEKNNRFVMHIYLNSFNWKINSAGNVQIDEYPEMVVSRTEDWGWMLENGYAMMKTLSLERENFKRDFKGIVEKAESKKQEGNAMFLRNNYRRALFMYKQANVLASTFCSSGYQELLPDALKKRYFTLVESIALNMCACYLKLKQYPEALKEANTALLINKSAKGLFRRGKAYMGIGELEKAKIDFQEAEKIVPNDREVREALRVVNKRLIKQEENRRKFFLKLFSGNK